MRIIKIRFPLSVLRQEPTPPKPSWTADERTLLEYYKEQLAHGRQIEIQRSAVAGAAFLICGVIIGELLIKGQLTREQLPFTVSLLCVGFFAWVHSAKLYERFRLHCEIAKLARNQLNPSLADFKLQAQNAHRKQYPFLFTLKLHVVWNSFYGLVFLFGLIATIICLTH